MRTAELVMAVVLGLFSIYLMVLSGAPSWEGDPWFQNIWYIPGEGPGGGFWPFWLAFAMLLSCVWIGVNWVRRTSPPSRSTEPFLDGYGVKMMLLVIGGVAGFIGLSQIISMYFAMVLFLAYYIGFLGRHSVKTTALIALLFPATLYFFFDRAMNIYPPRGLLAVEDAIYVPLDRFVDGVADTLLD